MPFQPQPQLYFHNEKQCLRIGLLIYDIIQEPDNRKCLDGRHSNREVHVSNPQPDHSSDLYASPYCDPQQRNLNNRKESTVPRTSLHQVVRLHILLGMLQGKIHDQ